MRARGFTLLEVLIAVLFVGILGTSLMSYLTQNVRSLGHRYEKEVAMGLAEERMRQIVSESTPDIGVSEGYFDQPYDFMRWRVSVEPYSVPLPPSKADQRQSSSIFAHANSNAPNGLRPSLRRVDVRVFLDDGDPNIADPFIFFTVDPNDIPQNVVAQYQETRQSVTAGRRPRSSGGGTEEGSDDGSGGRPGSGGDGGGGPVSQEPYDPYDDPNVSPPLAPPPPDWTPPANTRVFSR